MQELMHLSETETMKNTFGNSITVTLFGESHGSGVGVTIDGMTPGVTVDENAMKTLLDRRRPSSAIDTARQEPDNYQILSGVFNGKTTGAPITIFIPNTDTRSRDYNYGPARPSHADYTAFVKYSGFEDYRGGGHFSGRLTAALVAAGGIFIPVLENLGITVGTHILKCGSAWDRPFAFDPKRDIEALKKSSFPVLNPEVEEGITNEIMSAKMSVDSIGGVIQTAVCGLPAGLGEPWFDSVEGLISHAMFSLGGIKGIEFGAGFAFANMRGSDANDPFALDDDGNVVTTKNNNGGILGGITSGMPVVFQCAVKPTASVARAQNTVNFIENKETVLELKGRHDPAIIRRICPVADSVTAMVLCDLLSVTYGNDVFGKGIL